MEQERVNEETGEVVELVDAQVVEFRPGYYFPKPVEIDPLAELELRGKLARKLSDCYQHVESIPERGFNQFHKYKYVLAEDLYREVRKAFHEVGLAVVPLLHRYEEYEVLGRNDVRRKVLQPITFMVTDCETGYTMACPWHSEAMDNEDKGTGKSLTSALKYFLKTLLIVPTGDDPDAGEMPEADKQSAKAQKRPPQEAKAPPPSQPTEPVETPPSEQKAESDNPTVAMSERLGDKVAQARAYAKKHGLDWPAMLAEGYRCGCKNAVEFKAVMEKFIKPQEAKSETKAEE